MPPTDGDLARRIALLEDRAELHELVAVYGRLIDDRDVEGIGAIYTADAVFDSTAGPVSGRDAVLDYYRGQLDRYGMTYHYPHSHTVEFTGPDTATGVVSAHAELAIGDTPFVVALRYLDSYRREDGRWKFHERRAQQLYAAPLSELSTVLQTTLRKRWPGTEPAPADLPEPLPSWQAYAASRGSAG
ncbi:nuclear transport factor 2 family protein [Pseudonocardia sp. KRD-184]|uniref:Nuclear transport factor 2 family protein n=1 Tax=Pseudonocardia oceani TaxID=2792013 RepID=A0ABS6UF78_9PSEU|nr:nuclear transport factor 2 family protein [Pseudonocardia oceani]MBW0090153.1 nuclear transport factor 2 family protein [Pseudonocardia oceani]MBW0097283.1 nuclear transport factor 2 family protein [Pseudonocardia oceani]MBW0109958.1 nuclear transport factor 2 family protein [Pseudonocardia oceani]MBW0120974.1 nuclear transport factor 2 family protein [Pseudonocardia oceani]MBW0130881.1 nuclear transport factor 2 family protein [Pseudonocardia oceani]